MFLGIFKPPLVITGRGDWDEAHSEKVSYNPGDGWQEINEFGSLHN
jgi:hypothetical protein